ncbi:hypothetical protein [Crocosphaera chwakensis]|uniref:Uncharacterized protein n=1 Tax=Crocosphaera chwakensis CCY0110 TaxID=391612 RepID=A3IXV5_9CHRO|nr:hypothetical protein [Crocosphaera chwakensis]EAZ88713.1 hypothetical protein CY0110_14310 [Crocosphaera chwakensis CCY0110]
MYIRFNHYLIAEMANRAGWAGFGDCPKNPTFLEKGQALNERKVLSELLKFSEAIEEAIKPTEIYLRNRTFIDYEIIKLVRLESQKVTGYSYQLSQEKSLESIDRQLQYSEAENLFNKIREKGNLYIGELKNIKCVQLVMNSEQQSKDFEEN